MINNILSVQSLEGYVMLIYGDEISPSFSIFHQGQEVDGGTMDNFFFSLKEYIKHHF